MIWLKAFGLTLAVGALVAGGARVVYLTLEAVATWPDHFKILVSVASIIFSMLIWKKVLEE